jgi:hypothetical protein
MLVKEEIKKVIKERIDVAWNKLEEKYTDMFNEYFELIKDVDINFKSKVREEFILINMMHYDKDNAHNYAYYYTLPKDERRSYRTAYLTSKSQYDKLGKLVYQFIMIERDGSFEKFIKNQKEDYYKNAFAKLNKALNKHLTDDAELVDEMLLTETVKGFTVKCRVKLNNEIRYFKTDCIEAGGYNIQQFHYRYISHLK